MELYFGNKIIVTDFIDNNHVDCEPKYEGLLKVNHCGWVLSQIESEIPSINTDLLHCRLEEYFSFGRKKLILSMYALLLDIFKV